MSDADKCACGAGPTLVFACSGAADVGEIADRAARKLRDDGVGKMFCLAGVGGRVSGIMETTKSAAKILAIDGCSTDCVKNCLEQAGFTRFEYVRVTDLGMEKGTTPVTDERIAEVVAKARACIEG